MWVSTQPTSISFKIPLRPYWRVRMQTSTTTFGPKGRASVTYGVVNQGETWCQYTRLCISNEWKSYHKLKTWHLILFRSMLTFWWLLSTSLHWSFNKAKRINCYKSCGKIFSFLLRTGIPVTEKNRCGVSTMRHRISNPVPQQSYRVTKEKLPKKLWKEFWADPAWMLH